MISKSSMHSYHNGSGIPWRNTRFKAFLIFHAEPSIQATELLLQERTLRDVAADRPWAEDAKTSVAAHALDRPTVRRIRSAHGPTPALHLLSNGRYAVMLTAAGLRATAGGATLASHAVARRYNLRRLGFVHLLAGCPQRRRMVCGRSAQWHRTGQL